MAFDSLSEKLQNVFKNLRSKGRLTENDVKAALKEVKMALLEADVNFKVVKGFVKDVQERAIGQDVMNGLNISFWNSGRKKEKNLWKGKLKKCLHPKTFRALWKNSTTFAILIIW